MENETITAERLFRRDRGLLISESDLPIFLRPLFARNPAIDWKLSYKSCLYYTRLGPGFFIPLCFEDECLEKYPHDYAGGSAADAEGDPAEPPGAFGQAQSGISTGGSQEFMSFFMKTAILLIHTIGPYDQ